MRKLILGFGESSLGRGRGTRCKRAPAEMGQGIKFEDTGTFLAWNQDYKELMKLDNPEINNHDDKVDIFWRDKLLLKGLRCSLSASIIYDDPSFKSLSYTFGLSDKEVTEAFHYIKDHLYEHFGEPYKVNHLDDIDVDYYWEIDGNKVLLMFYQLHAYRCSLIISPTSSC
ncbi:MAG: hypothetical protein JXR03_04910 [Cyclobacteriaceae bacterium]